jgi:hypothetical protein
MTLTVAGWVECRNAPEAYLDYGEWAPVINLEPLLFDEQDIGGDSPFTDLSAEQSNPIAPGHGLPSDVSALVARDAARYNASHGVSFVLWAEIAPVRRREDLTDDWKLIFRMVDPLADAVGPENVRLVLWGYITEYGANDR